MSNKIKNRSNAPIQGAPILAKRKVVTLNLTLPRIREIYNSLQALHDFEYTSMATLKRMYQIVKNLFAQLDDIQEKETPLLTEGNLIQARKQKGEAGPEIVSATAAVEAKFKAFYKIEYPITIELLPKADWPDNDRTKFKTLNTQNGSVSLVRAYLNLVDEIIVDDEIINAPDAPPADTIAEQEQEILADTIESN